MAPLAIRRILLFTLFVLSAAGPALAQSAKPAYDVVSIKPHKPGSGAGSIDSSVEGYKGIDIPFSRLVQYAYNLFSYDQISGIPAQLVDARFDVTAKVDAETVAAFRKLPRDERIAKQRELMQDMLADRFQLRLHRNLKDAPIYAVMIAKGGFKLQEADPNHPETDAKAGSANSYSRDNIDVNVDGRAGIIVAQAVPIQRLVENLTYLVHRIVVDKTGLTGRYDFTLQWTEERDGQPVEDAKFPSLLIALPEQLGLRLESTRGQIEQIVIEHAGLPSEN